MRSIEGLHLLRGVLAIELQRPRRGLLQRVHQCAQILALQPVQGFVQEPEIHDCSAVDSGATPSWEAVCGWLPRLSLARNDALRASDYRWSSGASWVPYWVLLSCAGNCGARSAGQADHALGTWAEPELRATVSLRHQLTRPLLIACV